MSVYIYLGNIEYAQEVQARRSRERRAAYPQRQRASRYDPETLIAEAAQCPLSVLRASATAPIKGGARWDARSTEVDHNNPSGRMTVASSEELSPIRGSLASRLRLQSMDLEVGGSIPAERHRARSGTCCQQSRRLAKMSAACLAGIRFRPLFFYVGEWGNYDVELGLALREKGNCNGQRGTRCPGRGGAGLLEKK